jgi:hypothetical protein
LLPDVRKGAGAAFEEESARSRYGGTKMSASKIHGLLIGLLTALTLCARLLFPHIGLPNQLTQAIGFTASVGGALLFLIDRRQLPASTALRERVLVSFSVAVWLIMAVFALDTTGTSEARHGFVAILAALTVVIALERRPSKA